MSFLNPTYLWALLGLVIPVAIHLWSNKEGRTVKVGSIQFLENSDVKQTNSIKLNELLLLLLRMLLITVLVFILAEPRIQNEETNAPITYIVEPSLLKNDNYSSLLDSLQEQFSVRLLKSGFPNMDTYNPTEIIATIPNYWQLAIEMQDIRTDSLVVFTKAYFKGFKGKRPKLNKEISWIVLDAEMQPNEILEVVKKNDKIEVLEIVGEAQKLSFKKEKFPLISESLQINETKDSVSLSASEEKEWFPLKTQDSIKILIYHEGSLESTKTLLESSFNAISKYLERPVEVVAVRDTSGMAWNSYHTLIGLKENFNFGTTQRALIYVPDSLATSIIMPSAKKHIFHLTQKLTTENVLAENLPEQLLNLLDLNKDLKTKIDSLDKRTLDLKEFSTGISKTTSQNHTANFISISKWLWLLLVFLIITERIFSRIRKQ